MNQLLSPAGMHEMEQLDKILGTPSAQRILRLLVCWNKLPVKEIILKTGLSESQVHFTLNQLEKAFLLVKESRGVYGLANSPFTSSLKKAYTVILIQSIGHDLYELTKELDQLNPLDITRRLKEMVLQWRPILESHFSHNLSSLAEYTVDRYGEVSPRNAFDNGHSNSSKNRN